MLHFCQINSLIDPHGYAKVFAEQEIFYENCLVAQVHIIGYSHQITIHNQSQTEILSSVIPSGVSSKVIFQNVGIITLPKARIEVQKLSKQTVPLFQKSIQNFQKLHWDFQPGLTSVAWKIQAGQIQFQTLHTYPDLGIAILTKSWYPL